MYNNIINHHENLNKIYYDNCTRTVDNPPTDYEINTLLSKTNFNRDYAVRVITAYKNWSNNTNSKNSNSKNK